MGCLGCEESWVGSRWGRGGVVLGPNFVMSCCVSFPFLPCADQEGAGGMDSLGVLQYLHMYVGSDHILWFKIFNFSIISGFQKKLIIVGYGKIVDIFGDYY